MYVYISIYMCVCVCVCVCMPAFTILFYFCLQQLKVTNKIKLHL